MLLIGIACAPKEQIHEPAATPGVVLRGVHIHYFQGNRLATVGQMTRLTYERFTHDFIGSNSDLTFPKQEPGDPGDRTALRGFRIQSPILQGNITHRRATGLGGVTFIADNGTVGKTDRADFDGITRVAAGKDPVHVVGRQYAITAGDFLFQLRDEDYTFGKGVVTDVGGRPK